MKKLIVLFSLLFAGSAFAADNAVIVTPGVGVTMKSKDIGAGVQAMQPILSDTGGNALSMPTAGADGVSNISTGLLGYSRNLVFNGTTWDRWQGAVTVAGVATAANQTTINTSIGTTNTNLGAPGATVCATDTGSCSLNALFQRALQTLTLINTGVGSQIPAGTNTIGSVKTTDGTNTAIIDPCQGQTKVYTPINTVTANNTIIAGVSAKKKYICHIFIYPGATVNFAVYQATTGTSCATAATDILGGHTTATGFIATAQAGFVAGTGGYAIAATGTVNTDICITNGGTVQLSGSIVTVDQ